MNHQYLKIWRQLEQLASNSICIDKKVGCIITNQTGDIVARGFNMVHNCDRSCDTKKLCLVTHAEIVALILLHTMWKYGFNGDLVAWTNNFPCVPCQKALTPHVKDIVVFGKKHKEQVFPCIEVIDPVIMRDFEKDVADVRWYERHRGF